MSGPSIAAQRAAVAAEALTWMGTPFHHGARVKGAGVDCAQLALACYERHGVIATVVVEPYPRDWFLHQDRERILEWVERLFVAAPTPQPGDLATFRFGRGVSHCGVVVAGPEISVVHSFAGLGVVASEVRPGSPLGARLTGYWTPVPWSGV